MSEEKKILYGDTRGVCYNCLNGFHGGCEHEHCKCKLKDHKSWWWKTPAEIDVLNSTDRVQQLMNRIRVFADKNFAESNKAAIHHLKMECDEVLDDLNSGNDPSEEYADCLLLVLNSASAYGLTWEHLYQSMLLKMDKNEKREWGKPDENGVYQHIE